jgi:hypothetical protein|tara:strand:- start:4238 stop:4528 length:291 start_codon:yes stop_codon:yes gene_type:complete
MSLPTDNIQYFSGGLDSPNANKIFADKGFKKLTNPSAENVEGTFAIQSLSSFTFGTTAGINTDNLTGITIPAGVIIYGRFTAITGTGTLIAYGITS